MPEPNFQKRNLPHKKVNLTRLEKLFTIVLLPSTPQSIQFLPPGSLTALDHQH